MDEIKLRCACPCVSIMAFHNRRIPPQKDANGKCVLCHGTYVVNTKLGDEFESIVRKVVGEMMQEKSPKI